MLAGQASGPLQTQTISQSPLYPEFLGLKPEGLFLNPYGHFQNISQDLVFSPLAHFSGFKFRSHSEYLSKLP
jgi:hypothetical protein